MKDIYNLFMRNVLHNSIPLCKQLKTEEDSSTQGWYGNAVKYQKKKEIT